jgi:DNA-binding NtrC family response regulator
MSTDPNTVHSAPALEPSSEPDPQLLAVAKLAATSRPDLETSRADPGGDAGAGAVDLSCRLACYERALVHAALARANGCQRQAARLLGVLPTTLNEKLERLGLRAPNGN